MYQWHNYGKTHDRRARRRRERRHPAAAGVLPQLLPARQRDADRLRPLRRGAGARRWSPSFGPIPRPTRTLPPTYTLDPAQDGERTRHAAPRRRRAAGLCRLPRAAGAQRRLRRGDAARAGARRHARRPAAQASWSSASSRPAPSASPWRWPSRARCFIGAAARAGAGRRQGARGDAGDASSRSPASRSRAEELERARTQWLNDWDQGFADPERDRRRALGSDRPGRLAPLLPRPRQRAQGDAGRHPPGRGRAPAPRQPHRRHLPADRRSRSARRRRRASTSPALVKDYKGDPGAAQAESFDADAGEPRCAHPALRARQRPARSRCCPRARAARRCRRGCACASATWRRLNGQDDGRRLRRRAARQGRRRPDAPADRRPVRPAAGRGRVRRASGQARQRRHHDQARAPAGGDRAGGQAAARAELLRAGARGVPASSG